MIEAKWFYTRGGQQQEGPVSAESIRQMLMTGYVQPWDLAWCDGMPQWQPLHAIPDFADMAQTRAQMQGGGIPGGPLAYRSYAAEGPSESRRTAIIAFVVSIFSLICCGFVFGPVAIILAVNVKNDMKKSGDLRGYGYATAAFVIGIISVSLNVLGVAIRMMLK